MKPWGTDFTSIHEVLFGVRIIECLLCSQLISNDTMKVYTIRSQIIMINITAVQNFAFEYKFLQ